MNSSWLGAILVVAACTPSPLPLLLPLLSHIPIIDGGAIAVTSSSSDPPAVPPPSGDVVIIDYDGRDDTTPPTTTTTTRRAYGEEGYARLVSWLIENGGRVDSRMTMRTNVATGVRGIVTTSPIRSGSELLFCPWELVIGTTTAGNTNVIGGGGGDGGGSTRILDEMDMCDVVRRMAGEMRLGNDSHWDPYLDHISLPRLVASFDEIALMEMQDLPPRMEKDRHVIWYNERCRNRDGGGGGGGDGVDDIDDPDSIDNTDPLHVDANDDDDAIERSLLAFVSRASEVGMIPLYDMLNHHNGMRNAKLSLTEEGVVLVAVVGDRDDDDDDDDDDNDIVDGRRRRTRHEFIEEGREIFLSYGLKTASTMYRDYGFVEDWPTCWNFVDPTSGDNFAFVSLPHDSWAINPTGEYLRDMWTSNADQSAYEARARVHTESLTVIELERFVNAARRRSKEFRSTVDEDVLQLEGIRTSMMVQSDDDDSGGAANVEDVINAIGYRIALKSALGGSALYAESILASKIKEIVDKEEL